MFDADKSELENKIQDTSGLVKKTDYNAKITDIECKTPNVSSLVKKKQIIAVKSQKLKINLIIIIMINILLFQNLIP